MPVAAAGFSRIQASSEGIECALAVNSPWPLKSGRVSRLPSNRAAIAGVSSGKHEFCRALLAKVGDGGQLEIEIDGLIFPVELAACR